MARIEKAVNDTLDAGYRTGDIMSEGCTQAGGVLRTANRPLRLLLLAGCIMSDVDSSRPLLLCGGSLRTTTRVQIGA